MTINNIGYNPSFDIDFINPLDLEQGKTYPLYGAVTEVKETIEGYTLFINGGRVEATANIPAVNIELLKSRMFDPGIFICTVHNTNENKVFAHCETVIFGRKGVEQ